MAVLYALFLIYIENGRKQRVVLPQDQCVVEVLDHVPCDFLNLVAWINHVHSRIDRILNLNGESAGMAVEILCLALESVESVCVLDVEMCDASHVCYLLVFINNPVFANL